MEIILGSLAIVAITVVLGLVLDRRVAVLPAREHFESDKERARKQRITHGAGEAPSTALRLREAQVAKVRTSQRCGKCRASMRNDAHDRVRYADGELLVLQFTCPDCGTKRALYIATAME